MSDLQLAGEESPFPEQSRLEELVQDVIKQAPVSVLMRGLP
jgi:hypothetical protein